MNSRRLNLKSEDAKVRPAFAFAELTPCSSDNEAFNPIFQMQSSNPQQVIIAAAPVGVDPPANMDNTAENIFSAVKQRKQATFEERASIQNNSAGIAVKN